jgi:hypothetical protein
LNKVDGADSKYVVKKIVKNLQFFLPHIWNQHHRLNSKSFFKRSVSRAFKTSGGGDTRQELKLKVISAEYLLNLLANSSCCSFKSAYFRKASPSFSFGVRNK